MVSFIRILVTSVMVSFFKLGNFKIICACFFVASLISCTTKKSAQSNSFEEILPQVEAELRKLASVWYPKTVDTVNGGFWSDFNYKWEKEGKQNKFLVS